MLRILVGLSFFWSAACTTGMDSQISNPMVTPATRSTTTLLPSPSFKVAFVGDQGHSEETREVLRLIKEENVGLLIIPGDFDYSDSPDVWDAMLTEELGDLPILAAVGNHDLAKWPQYAAKLQARFDKMPKAHCTGELGVKHNCEYKGVQFIFSGVGTYRRGHEKFIADSLKNSNAAFKVCVWHKNQRKMQVGGKRDEVGWEAYEICRREGAIVITAHEHSYSRTHLLSDFQKQTIASKEQTLNLETGKSFAVVSGLGGRSIRDQHLGGDYWAKIYSSTQNAKSGALFCTFHTDNNPRAAACVFRNIKGEIIDSFGLESHVDEVKPEKIDVPLH